MGSLYRLMTGVEKLEAWKPKSPEKPTLAKTIASDRILMGRPRLESVDIAYCSASSASRVILGFSPLADSIENDFQTCRRVASHQFPL